MDKKAFDEKTVNAEADYFIEKKYNEMEEEMLLHWYKNHKISDFLTQFAENIISTTLLDKPSVHFLSLEKYESGGIKEIVFYFFDKNYINDGELRIPFFALDFDEEKEVSIDMFEVLKYNAKRQSTSLKLSEWKMMNALFWRSDEKCKRAISLFSKIHFLFKEKAEYSKYLELKSKFEGEQHAA